MSSVKLKARTEERVRRLAAARRTKPEEIMREAIEEYVERAEKQARFRQEATAAWAEYKRTGQHATFEEVDAWLARLEAGEDAEPPLCHD
jgi:predicted transcriptional regulator